MNAIASCSFTGRLLGFFLALALAGSAYAGPGLVYWQSSRVSAAPIRQQPLSAHVRTKVANVTALKSVLPNGRGPMRETLIGTQRVRETREAVTPVMKPSWRNARGPLRPVNVYGPVAL